MAEGGERPIYKVGQKYTVGSDRVGSIGLSDQKRIGHRLSAKFRQGRKAEEIDDVPTSGSPRDRAERLLADVNYKGAVGLLLLEDPFVTNPDNFLSKLVIAEGYLYMEDHKNGVKMIEEINKSIWVSLGGKPDDVMKYADNYLDQSKYIRALIVLRKASHMYKIGETSASAPDGSFNGIKVCSEEAHFATEQMIKAGGISRSLGDDYGIEYMKAILRDLRSLINAEPGAKALTAAWSCNSIGTSLQSVQKYKESKKYLKSGVKILVEQFGPDNLECRVYGSLMFHLGTAYDNLGKFKSKGEQYYRKAIEAKTKATDYLNENDKREDIKLSENVVKRASERRST